MILPFCNRDGGVHCINTVSDCRNSSCPPFQYLPTPTASASCLMVEMTTTELSGSAYSQCKQPLMEGTGEFPFLSFKGSFCWFFSNCILVCNSFRSYSPLLSSLPHAPSGALPRPDTSASFFNVSDLFICLFIWDRVLLGCLVSSPWIQRILLPPDNLEYRPVPLCPSPRTIFLVIKYKLFKVVPS